MAINNPLIPGDPFSYDLKWIVKKIKSHDIELSTLDEKISAAVVKYLDQHDPVYFENSDALINSGLRDGSLAYIEGFYTKEDGGANLYFVTTDYNDVLNAIFYITMAGANKWAIPVITTDYVTPLMFGAVGDGATDDTRAVKCVFEYCREKLRRAIFPNVEKGYYTTEPVTITQPDTYIEMHSPIYYRGSDAAITINTYHVGGNFMLQNGANGVEYYDAPAGSVGVKLLNADENTIEISSIYGYETGLLIEGNNDGCCYNNITLNAIGRCKTGVRCKANGSGWANENHFFGGSIWVASSDPFKNNCYGFSIEGSANHYANANTAYGVCLEGLTTAIYADYATLNRFEAVRTEGCNFALYALTAMRNVVNVSLGSINYHSDYASNIVNIMMETDVCEYLVCDSGDLSKQLVYNNNGNMFRNKITGMFSGSAALASGNQITRHDGYISIDGVRYIATKLSARTNKKFRLAQNCINGGTCRPFIAMFDANGVNITSGLKTGAPAETLSPATVGGATVFKPGNDWLDFIFEVPANCDFVIVGFCNSSSSKITGYKVYASTPYATAIEVDYNGLAAIPNSPALTGDTCPDSTGATNGWRYNGSAWEAI